MSDKNPAAAPEQESMVVRLSRLDHMLELAGEVIIVSSNLNALCHSINEGTTINRQVSQDLKDLAITSSRISGDLHHLVTDVRTVDMQDLFARFRRLARDTSRRLGKAVHFQVEGETTCIDKKIAEKIYDPIAHQIRNAIAHGIEDQQTRTAQGKDPVGNVTLSVQNLENVTRIDISDDGAGINYERVRQKIVQLNLADPSTVAQLCEAQLNDYLFRPGFTTAQETSASAGRGVGMDVVKNCLNEINGEILIKTAAQQGSTFTLLIPRVTAVNISDALLVKARRTCFAFPIASVIATRSISAADITTTTGKGRSILYLGNILPLFDLMQIMGESPLPLEDPIRIIILEHKNRRAAYVVSEFLSPQKIVISEFEDNLRVPGLVGTAILSVRQMGMVVDLPTLLDLTFGTEHDAEHRRETRNALITDEAAALPDEQPLAPEPAAPAAAAPVALTPVFVAASGESAGTEFLYEVESMLSRLNRELLELEENKTTQLANSIFRLMHSIKGNLTMYGAEKPAAITHQIETILEQVRHNIDQLSENVFDIFFDGAAYLEEVVKAFLNHQTPPAPVEDFLNQLNQELQAHQKTAPPAEPSPDSSQLTLDATGQFYLSSRRRDGAPLYQCHIEFESHDQPDFLMACLILNRIQKVADVLAAVPPMQEIEEGLCGKKLNVLISPRDSRADLMNLIGENLRKYYNVKVFEPAGYA